jgi:hypothetical protein
LVPLSFPVVLFAGAATLDFLLDRLSERGKWLQALVAGIGFVVVMILVQWPMGSFLISSLAENRIFGTAYYPYMQRPSDYHFSHEFLQYEKTRFLLLLNFALAFASAVLTTRIGLSWGEWMRRIKR